MNIVEQLRLKGFLQCREKTFRNRLNQRLARQWHHPGEIGSLGQKGCLDHQSLASFVIRNKRLLVGNLHPRANSGRTKTLPSANTFAVKPDARISSTDKNLEAPIKGCYPNRPARQQESRVNISAVDRGQGETPDLFPPDSLLPFPTFVSITEEIQKRRTFAIISHPDAGKTTLTEKLLLYGGAVQLAGSVTARKNQRATTSDWMELEKKRGISISSTVLQFDYDGYRLNLLDTPGHKDFSEDTYRVLTAVDSVVMVIDSAKGIEPQTRKLFEVCRQRGVPIFTFMNKCDRPMKDPLALLDELERVLGIGAFPVNWPIGDGF